MFWCCCNSVEIAREEPETSEVTLCHALPATTAKRQLTDEERTTAGERTPTSEASRTTPKAEAEVEEQVKASEEEESVEEEEEEEEVGAGPFEVTLDMIPGERLGALLDVLDLKTLRVVEVRRQGRLRTYNATAKQHKKVLPGYFIVEVNGVSGKAEDMVDAMRRTRIWRMKVARSQEFTVTVEKTDHLCLDLQFEKDSDCMVIRKIGDVGVVKKYNDSLPEGEPRVKPGDRIVDVNAAAGPAKTLLETIRGNTDLTMKIARPLM